MTPLDLARTAVHTITCKPMPLAELCPALKQRGFGGVCLWREAVAEAGGPAAAKAIVDDAGLSVPALVRGGFFPSPDAAERAAAIDENKRCLDEAAAVGAEMVVIVPGAHSGVPLADARTQVAEGLAALVDHAKALGVGLALEPLHPMYAGDRSCVNTLAQARAICAQIPDPIVGVAIDVYHVWWDPDLETEVGKLASLDGISRIMAFHVCDWLPDTANRLTDRGLMGDGCIDVRGIRTMVEATGYTGAVEVEVIGERYWDGDQSQYLDQIAERCAQAT